jgi:tetratricopeptide (TPR) repeat protein
VPRRRALRRATPVALGLVLLVAWTLAAASVRASDAVPAPAATLVAPSRTQHEAAEQLYATARMWAVKHRDDLARDAINKALLLEPDNAQLLAEKVRVLLRLGDARGAQATLAALRVTAPEAAPTRQIADEYRVATDGRQEMAMIRLLARSGRPDEAARRLAVLFPNGAPLGTLGAEYYQITAATRGGRAAALAALRRTVASDPSDTEAALTLARLLNASDQTRGEANRIAWRLALRPDADRAAVLAAWRHILQSADADPAYLDALRVYVTFMPDDAELIERIAAIEQHLDAQRRLERDPDYVAQRRGLQALARGDLSVADALLARAAQTRAGDADAVGGLGLVRMRQGRREEARVLFLRAAALAPDNRAKWMDLARTAQFWGTLAQGREAAAARRWRWSRTAWTRKPCSSTRCSHNATGPPRSRCCARCWPGPGPACRRYAACRRCTRTPAAEKPSRPCSTRCKAASAPRTTSVRWRSCAPTCSPASSPAAQRYEAAVRLQPAAVWTRFALARLYRDIGLPQLGRLVMDEGLAASDAPEMRYAVALYRNSTDDVAGALDALAPVAPQDATAGMQALSRAISSRSRRSRRRVRPLLATTASRRRRPWTGHAPWPPTTLICSRRPARC